MSFRSSDYIGLERKADDIRLLIEYSQYQLRAELKEYEKHM